MSARKNRERDTRQGRNADEQLSPDELSRVAGGFIQRGRAYTAGYWGPVNGTIGDDTLSGCIGDDTMDGGAGDDTMSGYFGNDSMDGSWGDDVMDGGAGNDTLEGGQGNDWLDSGSGDDTMTGGEGADTFVFGQQDGSDTVTDFNPAEDRLVFEGLGDPSELGVTVQDGSTVITFGETTITLEGVAMTPEQVFGCIMDDPADVDVDTPPSNVIL